MCKKTNYKIPNPRIDKCMRKLIKGISKIIDSEHTLKASCCGHGKYPMSIVVRDEINNINWDIISNKDIPRTRNFYKRDEDGFYYIPEVVNEIQNKRS